MSKRRAMRQGLTGLSDPMTRNSVALMGNTIVTSALGYVFWIVVARIFDTEAGGTAAATTSAIQATVLTASVGAAAALVEWLPRSADALQWRRRVTTAWVVGAVTALAGGSAVVAVFGFGFATLPQLATPPGAMLFVLGCVFFSIGQVIDYVAICEHRGGLLMMRNMVLSGTRIPLILLPVTVLTGADSILFSWTAAAGLSLLWTCLFFGNRGGNTLWPSFTGMRTHVREMASSLAGQHLITVTAMLAGYVLPIIVVSRLSATDNAYFYITWMLGSVFFIISPAVSAALFVEGAADPSKLPHQARRCLVIVLALLTAPVLVYVVAGRWILGVFGEDYAQHGYLLLLILAVSAVPDAISNVAVSVLRVTRRVRSALVLNVGVLIGSVVGAWYALPVLGIVGAGLAWTLSQALGAIWVLVRWKAILGGGVTPDLPAALAVCEDVAPVTAEGSVR
ncbi:lipopolysaccharide biosynthesis protein [Mycolicibacterium diernhoferi]|nr:lipopolysaccharide biosynthesis protein [Mycolicibacterium diernhoferi]QYL21189.1 lipopolysaccharide biosynthesis protein [Mycolicibacterium diernhoferi]